MYLEVRSQYKYGVTTTTSFYGAGAAVMDGWYPVDGNDTNTPVIDQFDVWLNGTAAQNRAKLTELRLALESAREFWGTARQAYLYCDVDETSVWWRSPIKSGRVVHNPQMLHQLNRDKMRITVIVERAPWWETNDDAVIPLSNGNGTDETGLTGGLRVYNCADHASVDTSYYRDLYATIDGVNDIDGDLPAPIDFNYANVGDLDINMRTIHCWNDKNSNPAAYSGLIEAEIYGTPVSLTGASGGNVASYTITNATETMFWTIDADAYVAHCKGQSFILAMRFKYDQIANLANLKFKLEIYETTYGSMYMSDWFYPVAATGYPVLVISPPFKPAPLEVGNLSATMNGYTLRLYAYQESGSSVSLVCDDFHMIPVPENGYRKLGVETRNLRIGFSYYYNSLDIQSQDLVYEMYQNASDIRDFVLPDKIGSVYVWPGVAQRLNWIFGMTTADTQTKINSAYLTVSATYKPRRRTI